MDQWTKLCGGESGRDPVFQAEFDRLNSEHVSAAAKFANEEEETANLAALNEQVDKDLEQAIKRLPKGKG